MAKVHEKDCSCKSVKREKIERNWLKCIQVVI